MNTASKRPKALSNTESQHYVSLGGLFEDALRKRIFSGASLLVGNPREILFHRTWGCCHAGGNPIDSWTRFDLASLTKPLVTAPLYIRSISRGKIDLDDPLGRFFPAAVVPADKRGITIRHLLNHCSGLPPYKPFFLELIAVPASEKRNHLLRRILDEPLLSPPGSEARYSDLGFQLLGIILETVWDKPLDHLASEIFPEEALGFYRLQVPSNPTIPSERLSDAVVSFAATEFCPWRNRLLEGEVHDENAYSMGGVAGHAGLFGTARGIYGFISSLWSVYGHKAESSEWPRDLLDLFWTRQNIIRDSTWALGFDTPSDTGSSAGVYFSPRSVGHLGFTGTSFWMDLDREILIILLTNRVYPTRENERMREFRPLLHNTVMEAHHASSRH